MSVDNDNRNIKKYCWNNLWSFIGNNTALMKCINNNFNRAMRACYRNGFNENELRIKVITESSLRFGLSLQTNGLFYATFPIEG